MIERMQGFHFPDLRQSQEKDIMVRNLQILLKGKGYDPGNIDGIYGLRTQLAVNKVNKEGCIQADHVTIETWQYILSK